MSESVLHRDTLFLACTRPAMIFGIPIKAFTLTFFVCGEVFVVTHRPITMGVVSAAAFLICRLIAKKDPNAFGLLFLWVSTKGRASINARWWGGSSSSPAPLRRPRRAKEISVYD